MHFRIVSFVAIIVLLNSCDANPNLEESLFIYDSEVKATFIRLLDDQDVSYRVNENGQIFYSVEKKETVVQAFETATGNKVPEFVLPPNPPR